MSTLPDARASALIAHAHASIRVGSGSFAAAARLFDSRTCQSAVMLYAWCRHCDDAVDGQTSGHGQVALDAAVAAARLEALRERTRRACRGDPVGEAAFDALAEVVRRHGLPERLPLALLDGFAMDVAGERFGTLEDTLRYCYHVAGVVGVMMAIVMGVRDDALLDRACDLGLAFQLTNIARDVAEDARIGRVYLPLQWLQEAGILAGRDADPAAAVADPARRERLASVVARLLDAAEPYYASAAIGARALPPRCAWAVSAAHGIYRDIGLRARALGPRAWDRRIATSRAAKLRHVALAAGVALQAALGAGRPVRLPQRAGLWTRP